MERPDADAGVYFGFKAAVWFMSVNQTKCTAEFASIGGTRSSSAGPNLTCAVSDLDYVEAAYINLCRPIYNRGRRRARVRRRTGNDILAGRLLGGDRLLVGCLFASATACSAAGLQDLPVGNLGLECMGTCELETPPV